MTSTVGRAGLTRHAHFHHADAPVAPVVVPSVFVQQRFAALFHARAVGGDPHGDGHETSEAAWVRGADLRGLPVEPARSSWIIEALSFDSVPHLG